MAHPDRITGRSTRQIDQMVQTLFTTGSVVINDHAHSAFGYEQPLLNTIYNLRRRLDLEHGLSGKYLTYDKRTRVLKIKKSYYERYNNEHYRETLKMIDEHKKNS